MLHELYKKYKEYKRKIKDNKRDTLWKNGYDWAAGSLLREELTPRSLYEQINSSDRNAFDLGAEAACNYLILLTIIEDDTI